MNTTINKTFEVHGITVEFVDRVFKIHTKDEVLEDLVLDYLEKEGYFDLCTELYQDDWEIL